MTKMMKMKCDKPRREDDDEEEGKDEEEMKMMKIVEKMMTKMKSMKVKSLKSMV